VQESPEERCYPWRRLWSAIAFSAAFALGIYVLLQAARPNSGVISFSFLIVLPAAICAFLAYIADPWGTRSHLQYLLIPLWVLVAVIVISAIVLREGVICILILSPLWLLCGLAGAEIAYRLRRVPKDGRAYCSTLIAMPIAMMVIEPMIPLPTSVVTVTRTADIAASPQALWPLVRGIPDVHPGEGRWNLSQDVIGIPRPISARLVGDGVGVQRFAVWGDHIRFREQINGWQPGRHIGWHFKFDDLAGWQMTDTHLMPNSSYFQVVSGGYRLQPLANGRTRLTLHTDYRIKTPLNAYAALWGELFLGDLENNLLALIAQRAPRRGSSPLDA